MNDVLWYISRGTAMAALVQLTIAMVFGIAGRSGRPLRLLPRFGVSLVHRNVSLMAVSFVAIHVLTLMFDAEAPLEALDLVIPFAGDYRPVWLGLGVVALYIQAAILVTSLLRHRLGARMWRTVHWLAYACWPLAITHAVGTGSDRATRWAWVVVAACVMGVLAALTWRLSDRFGEYSLVHLPAREAPVRGDTL